MSLKIDELMEYMDIPLCSTPILPPQRQERILKMTMKRIKETSRPRRPLRIAAWVATAAVLLCGTAFAAYEFDLFDLKQLFGQDAAMLEETATTFAPAPDEVTSAFSNLSYVSAGDYNYLIRGEVTATDTALYASFQVSQISDQITPFPDTGLQMAFAGHETTCFIRDSNPAIVNLYAPLDAPLSEGATADFLVTGEDTEALVLDAVPVVLSDANTLVVTDQDPSADYVPDTISMTQNSISITGHFQKEFADYAAQLDASGSYGLSFSFPLYDKYMDEFDPASAHEDLEGYLTRREVTDDGLFTLEWSMTKGIPGFGKLEWAGVTYELPEPEPSEAEAPSDFTPNFTNSAETQDYRFTLESMVSTGNMLCAIVDMEPVTEYGAAHMDLDASTLSIVCSNTTSSGGGTTGCRLIEAGEEMSRYLVYSLSRKQDAFQPGDIITFNILSIIEEGDTAEHSYSLFDVTLEQTLQTSTDAVQVSQEQDNLVHFDQVTLTPMTLFLSGTYDPNADTGELVPADVAFRNPEIILNLKDGTSITLLSASDAEDDTLSDCHIVCSDNSGDASGSVTHTYMFSQTIPLEDMDTILIDGITYQIQYNAG